MDFLSSTDDGYREFSDSEDLTGYDESEWHDRDCTTPFASQGFRETQKQYKHYYHISALRTSADSGCHLCVLVRSKIDRETKDHRPSEILQLEYIIYQRDLKDDIISFEVWIQYLKMPGNVKNRDVVWGIDIIDFLLAEHATVAGIGSHFVKPNSLSEDNRLLAKQWLANCSRYHEICNHPKTRECWMPTRLLEIDTASSTNGRIRLVTSSTIPPNIEYFTLSRCWGQKPLSRLTQANIENMRTSISLDDLPRTFQDAILVTKWFDCQYLWIDSLCIIQDSIEDWATESALMRHVYKYARLNIAAAAAVDSSSGLFFNRNQSLVSAGSVSVSWDGDLPKGLFYLFPRDFWERGVSNAPLNKRAWVVQERYLSRRNLHFGSRGMFFECHELEACESFPQQLPPFFKSLLGHRFKGMDAPADSSAAAKAKAFLRSWRKVFYAYANSSLTYASDKMVALAGVAEEFQEISDYTYLAGLWKEWFLADQLLWLAAPNKRRANAHPVGPSVYKAPSWSWMSFNGRVSASTATYPSLIEFLDAYTTLVDDKNSTGQVKGGLIRVRGQLEWVHLRKAHQSKETYSIYGVDDDQMGLVRVRFDEPSWRHNDVHCMPVRVCWGDTLEGLLLESTGQAHLEFRRVGHFQSIDKMPLEKLGRVVPEDKVVFTIV